MAPSPPDGLDGALALLEALVAFPTASETPNADLQAWLADRVTERGGIAEVVEGAPGRSNLLARFGPQRPGGIMLAGHTDVVPPGEGWATDPWKSTVVGDRVVGRGTADMKGFFAAALVVLERVRPETLNAPVYLLASYDEEIGCVGIRDVLPILRDSADMSPELVIVGEPTSMRPRHSHLGKQVYRVVVQTAEAHSSRAAQHPSSITEAARLVAVLGDIQAACPAAAVEAPPYSLNVGTIRGGSQTNVVAARCEFVFEVRFDADHRAESILSSFSVTVDHAAERLAALGGSITVEPLISYPALRSDPTVAAFRSVEAIADAGPAIDLGFGTEAGLIAEALGCAAMVCGPGDIAVAHRPDEYVPLDELARCIQFLTEVVGRRCQVPAASS